VELFSNSIANQSFDICAKESADEIPFIFDHNVLYSGQKLLNGYSLHLFEEDLPLREDNNRLWKNAELIMQHDGNLVLYITSNENKKEPIWVASGKGAFAELNDGQLVVMANSPYGRGDRSWCSDNWKEKGSYLQLEEHAGMPRIALYDLSHRVVWASNKDSNKDKGWCYDTTPW